MVELGCDLRVGPAVPQPVEVVPFRVEVGAEAGLEVAGSRLGAAAVQHQHVVYRHRALRAVT